MKTVNVGIDLGTTYSAVAVFNESTGKVEILKNSMGKDYTPSVVCIDNGQTLIGEEAKTEQKGGNVNTVAFYKNMMGNEDYHAYLDGEEYTAEDLSGIFLTELKKDVEATNDVRIAGAVITVPAYFNDKQREATIRAGKRAGLNVLKIINEPTSAIIAYGLTGGKNKNVMVYDLGGGTFDVSIARVEGTSIRVIATNGNHQLGGKDWDEAILSEVADRFEADYDINIREHPEDYKELQVACEEAKKRLSAMSATTVPVSCDGKSGRYEITKEMFRDRTEGLLNETFSLIQLCFDELTQAQGRPFGWSSLDEVVLVGGSTRMPQIKEAIVENYGKAPITKDINVDTIVAAGASMQAALCVSQQITLFVSQPKAGGGSVPMSLTIRGSDIQDITAHALGMLAKDAGGRRYVNSIIIPKNNKVNEVKSKTYVFAGKRLEVHVFQGESTDPYECDMLGSYEITGMLGGEKRKIDVNFLYNANGIMEISATTGGQTLQAKKLPTKEGLDEIIERLEEEERRAIEEAKRRSKIEIILVIDSSGSMDGDPIAKAKRVAKQDFVSQFDLKNTYFSVLEFADSTKFHCKNCNSAYQIENAIDSIEVGNVGYKTYGPLEGNVSFSQPDSTRIVVVLTDGCWFNKDAELVAAEKARQQGVQIYGIGIGDADQEFLDQISGGRGKKIDISQLQQAFREVASSIATEVANSTLR